MEGKLAEITDLARTYLGLDPLKEMVLVQPTAHYAMGGIPTDIDGQCLTDGAGGKVEASTPLASKPASASTAPTAWAPTAWATWWSLVAALVSRPPNMPVTRIMDAWAKTPKPKPVS
ncbi:hypothetical protein [Deinococcus radiophilus]|uniref:hypothetical protein n=1 Tax=Deinococcus radiophilus TaxID=32062 RepID=UPI00361601E3